NGTPSDLDVHRGQPPVQDRGARREGAHGLCAEPRRRPAAGAGREGPAHVAPRAHVRGRAVGNTEWNGGRGMTDQPIDPALLRGLTSSRFTRRDLFRYAGVAGGALGLSAILAACGTKGIATGSGGAAKPNANMGTAAWWGQQSLHHTLDFENWPYYMDIGSNGSHPSLDEFTKKTGIKVNYTEGI